MDGIVLEKVKASVRVLEAGKGLEEIAVVGVPAFNEERAITEFGKLGV